MLEKERFGSRFCSASLRAAQRPGLDIERISVIRLSLLPLASLQPEPGDHDGGEQERNHRARDCRALAELARDDSAMIRKRRHQLGGIERTAERLRPVQQAIGEYEQDTA